MTKSKIDDDDPLVVNALVSLVANVHPPRRMFLRTSAGEATDTDTEETFELAYNADGTPMVTAGEITVTFPWASLIQAAKESIEIRGRVLDGTLGDG